MAVTPWDEQKLAALYRHYQCCRDGISYSRYLPIHAAARQLIAETEVNQDQTERNEEEDLEPGIQSVLMAAQNMYLENANSRESDHLYDQPGKSTQTSPVSKWLLGGKLFSAIEVLFEQLTPTRWVPVMAVTVLVLVIAPFMVNTFKSANPGVPAYIAVQVDLLRQNEPVVAAEIEKLNSWQYGFSSSRDDFGRAFTSGILLVDFLSLPDIPGDASRDQLLKALRSNLEDEANILSGKSIKLPTSVEIDGFANDLLFLYRSNSLSSAYLLGQWVETAYLQSRLSLHSGQVKNLQSSLKNIDELIGRLERDGYYSGLLADDMVQIQTVSSGKLTLLDADEISNKLLKWRTILMLREP